MENLFSKCISSIINSDKPGYGFVNDFAECLLSADYAATGINSIVVVWTYEIGEGTTIELEYTHPTKKLSLGGYYKQTLLNANRVICSNDSDVSDFVSSDFLWHDHFVFIPVNSKLDSDRFQSVKGGIFLLSNKEDIKLDAQQAETIRLLMNNKQPCVYESACVTDYVKAIQEHPATALPIGKRWDGILRALTFLSGGNSEISTEVHGVRYATFWKLNNLEKLKEGIFYKQKERCFDKVHQPSSSHESIEYSHHHFINDIRVYSGNHNLETWPIKIYTYNEVADSFADKDFLKASNMDGNEMTAFLIPIPVDGGMGMTSLDICCLYIKDIIYTPFVSKQFCKQLQGFIRKSLEETNSRVQSAMVTQLMNTYFSLKENVRFYKSAAKILSVSNSMSDCLIYMCGTQDELLYMRDEDANEPKTFKNRSVQIGERRCYLPIEYAMDEKFKKFLSNYSILDDNETNTATTYRGEGKDLIVKSALFICIQDDTQKENTGLIILINKTHDDLLEGECDFDIITRDNVFATYLSALYLNQFGLWNKAVSRKNYLLKKLRHEIPNCTRVIGEKMKKVASNLKEKGIGHEEISSSINTIELNRSRINILASFFAAVDYEDHRFAEFTVKQDIVSLIKDNMPLFKGEASAKGVGIVLNTFVERRLLSISNFYPLAIVNVVNNAIRYCSLASNIIINIYEDHIDISDIGLPISEMELKLIFDDGYRSSGAKEINAEGIGYGLHLAKRVLNAHESKIYAESNLLSENNFILESGVALYLKALPPIQKRKFMYDSSEDSERPQIDAMATRIAEELQNPIENLLPFYCRNEMLVRKMIAEQANLGGPKFVEMEFTWFMEPVAKVTFTIEYGDKILC